jgi:hypothetical protein
VTDDELAAVIAALQMVTNEEPAPAPAQSAWKRAARVEAVGAFDDERLTRVS